MLVLQPECTSGQVTNTLPESKTMRLTKHWQHKLFHADIVCRLALFVRALLSDERLAQRDGVGPSEVSSERLRRERINHV
jgi:hypothetical protein